MADKNIHNQHRQRIKNKVDKSGLKSFAEHEVLELMLTYSIPRKDTNPIAHELINSFGSLTNVIKANKSDLLKINGVGEETTRFLNYLSQFVEYCENQKRERSNVKIISTDDCVKYFRAYFTIKETENLYVVCLNKKLYVNKVLSFDGIDSATVLLDSRQLASSIADKGVYAIAVFHTHPHGSVNPTKEDYLATKRIKMLCQTIGIVFIDHIIFNEIEHYSFERTWEKENGIVLNDAILKFDEDLETKFKLNKK